MELTEFQQLVSDQTGMVILTHSQIDFLTMRLSNYMKSELIGDNDLLVYPIPRGGVAVAYLLQKFIPRVRIVDSPDQADCFIDDLVDSGATRKHYCKQYPNRSFYALINKDIEKRFQGKWIVFPWESGVENDESGTDIVVRLLQYIGEDPRREGLKETPHRVVKAWKHWTQGYHMNAKNILKSFQDGSENYDQMVTVKDIPFYSHCEHHLAPFFGTATISYVPNGRIVGLSKLSRLVDMFARRLQVQERLTAQIADTLQEELSPLGVGVAIKARHLCMESRGICQQGHHTVTTALRGVIRTDDIARSEFLSTVK